MYTVKHLDQQHVEALSNLIVRYSVGCPDAKVLPAEFYLHHPAMEHGANVLCAFDDVGYLLAFAPLLPVPVTEQTDQKVPNHIWTVITVDPDVKDRHTLRELLFDKAYQRALEIRSAFGERDTRLSSDLVDSQREEIEYFRSKGFTHYQSVFLMARDCRKPLPDLPVPSDVAIRRWRVETLDEQRKYIKAHDSVFDTSPMTLEGLSSFLMSKEWSVGTIVSAFDLDDQLVGGVTVFWNEAENERTGSRCGTTEDVFVVRQWRGRGIAKYLVRDALAYLRENGIEEARLEVRTDNDAALRLYMSLGYEIAREELLLGMLI